MKTLNYLLICSFLFFSALTTQAAVVTWNGGTGVWDDENNWDTGTVPKAGDGVIINSGTVTVDGYSEANYIHLDGGNLIVDASGLLYISPDIPWYGASANQVRGMVIESGSHYDNYGSTLLIEPNNFSGIAKLIFCDGDISNHSTGFLFFQGENSTGLHTYINSGTIYNYGEISMSFVEEGMYLIGPFRNYGDIEIGAEDIAINNRESFWSSSSSNLEVNGRVITSSGSVWNQYGNVLINYTNTGNSNVISMHGLFEIQNYASLKVYGSYSPVNVASTGTFRNRGNAEIINDRQFKAALTNSGFLVNHQKGVLITSGDYGVFNGNGAEVRNFGTWNCLDDAATHYTTLWNEGVFSNRPKGKLYAHGKLNLKPGSTFNNQGHMFVLDSYGHQDLSGNFNNTGTLNDVHDDMGSINNNTSYRVHKMSGPFTEGVPVPNVLDKGSSPAATVLEWYTTASGSTIAGTYNSTTNTFTPNANAVGLTSLFVRTRINTGGVTRRHELIVENGINSNPSPFVTMNSNQPVTNAKVEIAPNPILDNFSILVDIAEPQTLRYALYNSMGQIETSSNFNTKSNSIDFPGHLPSGLYFVQVYDADGQHIETKQIRVVR